MAGTYEASTFTLTSFTGTTGLLLAGATVDATLAPDGTTSGRLFVPGGEEDGSADAFIGEAEFIAGRNTLTAEGTFGGVSIFLQLVKAD